MQKLIALADSGKWTLWYVKNTNGPGYGFLIESPTRQNLGIIYADNKVAWDRVPYKKLGAIASTIAANKSRGNRINLKDLQKTF